MTRKLLILTFLNLVVSIVTLVYLVVSMKGISSGFEKMQDFSQKAESSLDTIITILRMYVRV